MNEVIIAVTIYCTKIHGVHDLTQKCISNIINCLDKQQQDRSISNFKSNLVLYGVCIKEYKP